MFYLKISADVDKPIFQQIKESIENAILSGNFQESCKIPSITEISTICQVNPATALKGINLLVKDNIIYKKKGVGMFVCNDAVNKLREKRKMEFLEKYVLPLICEAKKLHISENEIKKMIEKEFT